MVSSGTRARACGRGGGVPPPSAPRRRPGRGARPGGGMGGAARRREGRALTMAEGAPRRGRGGGGEGRGSVGAEDPWKGRARARRARRATPRARADGAGERANHARGAPRARQEEDPRCECVRLAHAPLACQCLRLTRNFSPRPATARAHPHSIHTMHAAVVLREVGDALRAARTGARGGLLDELRDGPALARMLARLRALEAAPPGPASALDAASSRCAARACAGWGRVRAPQPQPHPPRSSHTPAPLPTAARRPQAALQASRGGPVQ